MCTSPNWMAPFQSSRGMGLLLSRWAAVTLSYKPVPEQPTRIPGGVHLKFLDPVAAADATTAPRRTPTKDRFGAQWFTGKSTRMIRFDLSITLDYEVLAPSDFIFIIQP